MGIIIIDTWVENWANSIFHNWVFLEKSCIYSLEMVFWKVLYFRALKTIPLGPRARRVYWSSFKLNHNSFVLVKFCFKLDMNKINMINILFTQLYPQQKFPKCIRQPFTLFPFSHQHSEVCIVSGLGCNHHKILHKYITNIFMNGYLEISFIVIKMFKTRIRCLR